MGLNYVDHNHIGHNSLLHDYIRINYIGHSYIGHNDIRHNHIRHNYIRHNYMRHNYIHHMQVEFTDQQRAGRLNDTREGTHASRLKLAADDAVARPCGSAVMCGLGLGLCVARCLRVAKSPSGILVIGLVQLARHRLVLLSCIAYR